MPAPQTPIVFIIDGSIAYTAPLRLFQEPDIVLRIKAFKSLITIFELADCVPYPSRKANPVYLLLSMPKFLEYFGMDHAAPKDLYPAGVFIQTLQPLPPADAACDVHLRTRLGEGEIGGPETHFDILVEHLLYKKK